MFTQQCRLVYNHSIFIYLSIWIYISTYFINLGGTPEYDIVVVRWGIVGLNIFNLGGTPEYDIVVVGGGIVGLAVAQEITNRTSSFKVRIFFSIFLFYLYIINKFNPDLVWQIQLISIKG